MTNELTSKRGQYLEAHPKERELQTAIIAEFNKIHSTLVAKNKDKGQLEIDLINGMRKCGLFLNELADLLPGKQITLDFYEQGFGGEPLKIEFEQIRRFQHVANNLAQDITTVAEAQQFKQDMFAAFEDMPKSFRPQQNAKALIVPRSVFLDSFKDVAIAIDAVIEADGDISTWDQAVKESTRLQLAEPYKRISEAWEKLNG